MYSSWLLFAIRCWNKLEKWKTCCSIHNISNDSKLYTKYRSENLKSHKTDIFKRTHLKVSKFVTLPTNIARQTKLFKNNFTTLKQFFRKHIFPRARTLVGGKKKCASNWRNDGAPLCERFYALDRDWDRDERVNWTICKMVNLHAYDERMSDL